MSSIFTKIINREIPAYIVAEDHENIAFLDINPLTRGHVLAVPKKQVDYLFDLDNASYTSLNLFAKRVAAAIREVTGKRIGTAVMGLEVPHAHIHLIPFTEMSELNFANPKLKISQEELSTLSAEIGHAYQSQR